MRPLVAIWSLLYGEHQKLLYKSIFGSNFQHVDGCPGDDSRYGYRCGYLFLRGGAEYRSTEETRRYRDVCDWAAPSDFARNDLDTEDMNVEVDLDVTQVAEPAGKKWKKDGVTKDMMSLCVDDAALKAAMEVMALIASDSDMRENVWLIAWTML